MKALRSLTLIFFAVAAFARVDRVEITSRADINDGKAFGAAGVYERIEGRVYFKIRPDKAHNRQIVDLDKADRNSDGEVEFSADLYLLKPKDMSRGNGSVLFEVSNRGGKGILRLVNGGSASQEFGDGFLMRQGYTIAWIGWEYDVDSPNGLRSYLPMARGPKGQSIVGLVRGDFTPSVKRFDWPLGHILLGPNGGKSYARDDSSNFRSTLSVRDLPAGPRQIIPRQQWGFGREVAGQLTPDSHFLHLKNGFVTGKIYEFVYPTKDPVVVGLGLAGVRDFLSYLKYDPQTVAPVKRAYAVGISQSGRFLRHFLYQDFNADEQSRQVLDGVIAHVAGAGRGSFNHRFAQPSRDAQPMSSIFFPTDLFPFTDVPEKDSVTGETAGLLDAANKSHTVPKIFYSNASYEYWGRAASLIHISPDGKADAKIPDNTRIYFLAGLQHFSDPFPPQKTTPGNSDSTAQQRHNPNPIRWFWRAFITDMDQWVKDGIQPPPSTYPKIAGGTLVALEKLQFPKIPGVNTPQDVNLAYRLDFGRYWKQGVVTYEPPKVGKPYAVLVPQADKDGNDLGGVRLPELSVPLATYTGWNLRDPSIGAPERRLSFLGSFIPFAKDETTRRANGAVDPRLSVAERYTSREEYLEKYEGAARQLIKQRFMLTEDLPLVLERGGQEWDEVMK
jgi:Alpha/beta hydrolase domain